MAEEDKLAPVVARIDRIEAKVDGHEGRIAVVEASVKIHDGKLQLGAASMEAIRATVASSQTEIRAIGERVTSDNRAANAEYKADLAEKLPRPLPKWVQSAGGAFLGVILAILAFVAKVIWDQRTEQAAQSQVQATQGGAIEQIKDSAARQEAALRELGATIRGTAPAKGTP